MQDAPREVRLRAAAGLAGRNRFKDHQLAGKILREFLDAGIGPAVIIAHLSEMVRALAQSSNWRAGLNEGAVLEHLDLLLGEAEAEKMDAATLASAFATFVADIGSGFTKAMREGLIKRAGVTLNEGKAGTSQKAWLAILAAIYTDPCHRGLAAAMELLARAHQMAIGSASATMRRHLERSVALPIHGGTSRR